MTRRVRAGVDPDDSQVSGPGAAVHGHAVCDNCAAGIDQDAADAAAWAYVRANWRTAWHGPWRALGETVTRRAVCLRRHGGYIVATEYRTDVGAYTLCEVDYAEPHEAAAAFMLRLRQVAA